LPDNLFLGIPLDLIGFLDQVADLIPVLYSLCP
jgi:hypothetical protein